MPETPVIERLARDMKDALRSGDKVRLSVIRLLRAQLHNAVIKHGRALSDDEILSELSSAMKMRQEAIEKFDQGQRQDLVQKERAELEVLRDYMPEPISEEDLSAIIDQTVHQVGAKGPGDLGLVMKKIMPLVRGRADGGWVNRLAREKLQQL